MALFGRKESGPRLIRCPNCSAAQEVSPAAQSVVCRHCNVTIRVTDQKITQYSATVSLETCGALTIEKKGALVVQKRVVVSNLTLKGSLKGDTLVYDTARIAAGAQLVGKLKARVLRVEDGAALKGYIEVVPANGCVMVEPPKELAGRVKDY
ncbi:MAG: polymer-forming cytoskeletal protein [Planctomycetota bacterium]|nr:polymer-forming cytoskeletal protein [Planctomycetota bacterium]